jgi:hypothetical protein
MLRTGTAYGWLPRQTGGANCGTQYPAKLAGGLRMVYEGRETMKFGVGFALTAQADPMALRDMAQTLDGAGFDYVTTAGHLLCAPPDITGAQSLQRIIEARQALAAAGY